MVRKIDAQVFFSALMLTCGASVVYAQGVNKEMVTPVDLNVMLMDSVSVDAKSVPSDPKVEKVAEDRPAETVADTSMVKDTSVSAKTDDSQNILASDTGVSPVNSDVKSVPPVADVSATNAGKNDPAAVKKDLGQNIFATNTEVLLVDSDTKAVPPVANVSVDKPASINGNDNTSVAFTNTTVPSEDLLGVLDNDLFKEMANIERETALLTLKAKRDRLLADIEKSNAELRKNQMDEMERREQMVRDRVKWEIEQEEQAKERAKREAEEKAEAERLEAEKAKAKEGEISSNVFEDEEDITLVYTIREIKGINGELIAVLNSERGAFDAGVGYPLKNGFKVAEITPSTVKIKRGDDVALLLFSEMGAGGGTVRPRANGSTVRRSSARKTTARSSSRR